MVKSAKECITQQASNSEMYGKMQAVFIEMDKAPSVSYSSHVNIFINFSVFFLNAIDIAYIL